MAMLDSVCNILREEESVIHKCKNTWLATKTRTYLIFYLFPCYILISPLVAVGGDGSGRGGSDPYAPNGNFQIRQCHPEKSPHA